MAGKSRIETGGSAGDDCDIIPLFPVGEGGAASGNDAHTTPDLARTEHTLFVKMPNAIRRMVISAGLASKDDITIQDGRVLVRTPKGTIPLSQFIREKVGRLGYGA